MELRLSAQLYNLQHGNNREIKEIYHTLIQNKHRISWSQPFVKVPSMATTK